MIYLDSAATSLHKPPQVAQAAANAILHLGNAGRGAHEATLSAGRVIYEAREKLAELFGVGAPMRVCMMFNTTDARNTAIGRLTRPGDHVVTTEAEHTSVLRPLYRAEQRGARLTIVPMDKTTGRVREADILAAIRPDTRAVVCAHASNVTGNALDIEAIGSYCRAHGILFLVDAAQSAGAFDIDMQRMGISALCLPGHKGLLGPQGTGVLLCGDAGRPLLCGGTGSDSINEKMPDYLPDRLEAGTHNVAGIAGLREGIRYIKSMGEERICGYETMLCGIMADRLSEVEGLTVYRSNRSQAGVLSVRHKRIDPEALCGMLGEHGIAARCGLHCAPLAHRTVGTLDTGTLRLSFSPFLSKANVIEAANTITRLINSKIHQ